MRSGNWGAALRIAGMFGLAAGIGLICGEGAWARDLPSAAASYTSNIKVIAQALSVTGIVAGGGLMQIPGAAGFGRKTLAGGLVGGLCAFGAPAFQSLMTTVFGSG